MKRAPRSTSSSATSCNSSKVVSNGLSAETVAVFDNDGLDDDHCQDSDDDQHCEQKLHDGTDKVASVVRGSV